jgi:hypothetical protein
MILGDVEETITVVEYDEDTYEELVKVRETSRNPHALDARALVSSTLVKLS